MEREIRWNPCARSVYTHCVIDHLPEGSSATRRLGRFMLAVALPLVGAICLFFVAGFLAVEGMRFWGERGPNLLGWAVPVTLCWVAGTAFWIFGVWHRVPWRLWAGAALLLAVPAGGWTTLHLVAWA